MRRRPRRALILAAESRDDNVVADDIAVLVDAVAVQALGAVQATREGVVGVDDLVGRRLDFVGGREVLGIVLDVLPVLFVVLALPVIALPCWNGGDGGDEGSEGDGGEMHGVFDL